MDLATLLEDALTERGNAVLVIARPADGDDAVIQAANIPFARMMGLPPDTILGARLAELRPMIERAEDWFALIEALRTLSPLTLDMKLAVRGRHSFLGFSLTFKPESDNGTDLGILIGRDITETRERAARESEMQRMLASVFLTVSAAVAIVAADGAILMANPACQRLLGYDGGELVGVNVETLTAPEFAAAAREARTRQLRDGGGFQMSMDVLTRNGMSVPVTLSSALLVPHVLDSTVNL